MDNHRKAHWDSMELNTYNSPVPPKTMAEFLRTLQHTITRYAESVSHEQVPSVSTQLEIVELLLAECERKRPTGAGGKHGNLHTFDCGCEGRHG